MKQYKYRINGNLYNVTVNDIDEKNIVTVEVNGAPYSVELDRPVNNRFKALLSAQSPTP